MGDQSAVDYLFNDLIANPGNFISAYKQAKKMEKEQIKDAHLIGLITSMEMEATKQSEQYYNETFKNS